MKQRPRVVITIYCINTVIVNKVTCFHNLICNQLSQSNRLLNQNLWYIIYYYDILVYYVKQDPNIYSYLPGQKNLSEKTILDSPSNLFFVEYWMILRLYLLKEVVLGKSFTVINKVCSYIYLYSMVLCLWKFIYLKHSIYDLIKPDRNVTW